MDAPTFLETKPQNNTNGHSETLNELKKKLVSQKVEPPTPPLSLIIKTTAG